MRHRACATCLENATRARTRAAIASAAAGGAAGAGGAGAGAGISRAVSSSLKGDDEDAESQGSGRYGDLASTAGPREGGGEEGGKVDEEALAALTAKHEELLSQVCVVCGCARPQCCRVALAVLCKALYMRSRVRLTPSTSGGVPSASFTLTPAA
jgi:hypothetical protein